MTNEEIKTKIIESIDTATKDNTYKLVKGYWGSYYKCGCAMACVLLANGKELTNHFQQLKDILDVDDDWIWSFIDGFDNASIITGKNKDAYAMGKDIREQFKPEEIDIWLNEERTKDNGIK